jgi:hypothetical protein
MRIQDAVWVRHFVTVIFSKNPIWHFGMLDAPITTPDLFGEKQRRPYRTTFKNNFRQQTIKE